MAADVGDRCSTVLCKCAEILARILDRGQILEMLDGGEIVCGTSNVLSTISEWAIVTQVQRMPGVDPMYTLHVFRQGHYRSIRKNRELSIHDTIYVSHVRQLGVR